MSTANQFIKNVKFSKEVQLARNEGKPIVALESTIISHGMPYPYNLETALEVEEIIRKHDVAPATIAIIEGVIHIGLGPDELKYLSTAKDILKVNTRVIPYALAQKKSGATTVSGTIFCADKVNIPVMVTGGIGGVHREAELSFDISADLTELSRSNVTVVCAGIKSILDIEKTLEYLETLCVSVIGYQTNDFPAFYTRKSGVKTDIQLNGPEEIADLMKYKQETSIKGGIVVANPIPEEFSLDEELMTNIIKEAILNCKKANIKGKEITPFLLDQVAKRTHGKSLESNIHLVKNNAKLGALIAGQYSTLSRT